MAGLSSVKHVLRLRDLELEDALLVLETASKMKRTPDEFADKAARRCLLLLLQKTSTRTALSFQAAIHGVGGFAVVLNWQDSNFSISPLEYEIRYASLDCDLVVARLRTHADLQELAEHSSSPVINGCDDRYHPSQVLADLLTMQETIGAISGTTVCYVGVRNNVASGLIEAAHLLQFRLLLVTPVRNPAATDADLDQLVETSDWVEERESLASAAAEADFVYTDTWVDMEQYADPAFEDVRSQRIERMKPFQVSPENLGSAAPWIMHPMPIHPGYEISADLIESSKSLIYAQSANRRYTQQALILWCLGIS